MRDKAIPASTARRRARAFPATAKASHQPVFVAGVWADEDAWADATDLTDLPRESGFGFLTSRAGRAVRSEGWEG